MKRKAQIGATGLWVSRVLLAVSALVLWGYARFCPPSPAFQGILLALTFLGGAALSLSGAVRYRTVLARRAAADATLGLAVMISALAFLLTVLSNWEESLSVTRAGPISKFGFAYGTLPGHVESGEERFLIEWNRGDNRVWFDIVAFSRPNHFLTRFGYPVVRRLQKQFGRDSAAAMLKAVRLGED